MLNYMYCHVPTYDCALSNRTFKRQLNFTRYTDVPMQHRHLGIKINTLCDISGYKHDMIGEEQNKCKCNSNSSDSHTLETEGGMTRT